MKMKKSKVRKEFGKYFCENTKCEKWTKDGCLLRKVGLTCDNMECKFNVSPIPGVYQCGCMDVHLDADGKCMSVFYDCIDCPGCG
jgi:hypothetical protein